MIMEERCFATVIGCGMECSYTVAGGDSPPHEQLLLRCTSLQVQTSATFQQPSADIFIDLSSGACSLHLHELVALHRVAL